MNPDSFNPNGPLSKAIVWDSSVFQDRGPNILASAVNRFDERSLHKVIEQNPLYFFDVQRICWGHTGTVGKAPDFVGVDGSGNVHMAEVKWKGGWHHKLFDQIPCYAKNFWISDHTNRKLVIHIACPQGACRNLLSSIMNALNPLALWKAIQFRFGFIQIGWNSEDNAQYYMRVIWLDGASWNGRGFVGQPPGLDLYDHPCNLQSIQLTVSTTPP